MVFNKTLLKPYWKMPFLNLSETFHEEFMQCVSKVLKKHFWTWIIMAFWNKFSKRFEKGSLELFFSYHFLNIFEKSYVNISIYKFNQPPSLNPSSISPILPLMCDSLMFFNHSCSVISLVAVYFSSCQHLNPSLHLSYTK